jgi:hypothetical protein
VDDFVEARSSAGSFSVRFALISTGGGAYRITATVLASHLA